MLENDGKTLRYSATLVSIMLLLLPFLARGPEFKFERVDNNFFIIQDSTNPDDKGRSFIITFKLSDDTLTIFEKTIK